MWNISCCSNTLTSRKSASWLKLTRYLRLGHPSQGEAFPSVELAQVAAAPVRGPSTGHRARSCGQSQEQQREAQEPRHLLKPESDLWSLPDEKKRKEKEKKIPSSLARVSHKKRPAKICAQRVVSVSERQRELKAHPAPAEVSVGVRYTPLLLLLLLLLYLLLLLLLLSAAEM